MCNVNRWFYRCTDCLTVTAANENLQQQWDRTRWAPAATCGLCGGPVENMGRVEGPRLIKLIQTLVKAQPVLCNPDNAKAAIVDAEFREALAPLVAERDRIDRKREQAYNGWLERSDFDRHRELCRLIAKARESRTHTNRMKIIRAASIQETVA